MNSISENEIEEIALGVEVHYQAPVKEYGYFKTLSELELNELKNGQN